MDTVVEMNGGISNDGVSTTAPPFSNDNEQEDINVITTTIQRISDILPPLLDDGSSSLKRRRRRIYLLRHGETEWNKLGKIQGGGFDIPLNDNGRQQAMAAALALDGIPLGVVASSHLSRAKETADIVWQHRHRHRQQHHYNGSVPIDDRRRVVLEGLGEMRFGELEGLSSRDLQLDASLKKRFHTIKAEIKRDPLKAFPGGGESTIDVQERAVAALGKMLMDFPDEQHIAIVSHGRTNKVLIAATAMGDVMQYPTVLQGSEYHL